MRKKQHTDDDIQLGSPPQLFIHVRIAVAGKEIDQLKDLRDNLIVLAERLSPEYAIRIKRRQITADQAATLRAAYEARAKLT